ncbi:enoyl-CoA hydratase/isomerase family protein [Ensifer soli]|uniref:enoyl-CoA hydratase/isomerase family protein n=1 Tax=Ciceribacter sp. sgz301302 TaxID=3342379 RepID=UPI0035B8534D
MKLTIDGRVATILIDRQERRNALDNAALEALIDATETLRRSGVVAAVVSGAGDRAFSAGSDLKALATYPPAEVAHHTYLFQKCTQALDALNVATIAAIEGFCLGGGLELALTCDYRVSSAASTFGFPEIRLNAVPSGGGTFRAVRAMGLTRAREMLLFGGRIDAETALQRNLVSEIVAPGTAHARAMELAEALAAQVAPLTIALVKGAILGGVEASASAGNALAYFADLAVSQSGDYRQGIMGFAEKTKA